jgi:hypothetical protein
VKTTTLLLACAALMVCIAAFADPTGYTETFNSGSNMAWGTDYGRGEYGYWPDLFGSNYDEDGAGYSSTGGVTGGYDYVSVSGSLTYELFTVFADSDASGGALAGNRDYSVLPSLEAYVKWDGASYCPGVLFFASTLDSSTNPVGASNLTLFYYSDVVFEASSSWTHQTADLTSSSGWYAALGSGDWSSALSDVDVVGVSFQPFSEGNFMVDNFVGTPEPGLFAVMAPMAGFLGWRLRRAGRKKPTG